MVTKHKKSARQGGGYRSTAFTIVELLTVLAIIVILVALLIPALTVVRNMAKETQQKAQLTTIEMGLTAFKNDYGDYPPSSSQEGDPDPSDYSGAQRLAEALVGWDLLGFHPDSEWDSGGSAYDPPTPSEDNLKKRVGSYLELATANVFRLRHNPPGKPGLFNFETAPLAEDTFVLCDVFAVRRITLTTGSIVKAGTPILYYKANPSSKTLAGDIKKRIYNAFDNVYLIRLGSLTADGTGGKPHPLAGLNKLYDFDDKGGIKDSKITNIDWPHRPDSYILISAGVDGLYGTNDDIRNF